MTSVKHPITSDGCTSCRTTAESFLSKDRNLQAAAVPQKLFCYCCNQDLVLSFCTSTLSCKANSSAVNFSAMTVMRTQTNMKAADLKARLLQSNVGAARSCGNLNQ